MNVKIGVIGTPPGVMPCALSRRCPNRGFAVDAAHIVCEKLNLSCTYEWSKTSEYGDADDWGNGTGLVGLIQRGTYDTSVPVFTPTYKRYKAIGFSDIYFQFDVLFVTRRPASDRPMFNLSMIHAFQWRTWCAFFAALVLTATVISLATRFVAVANRVASATSIMNTFFSTFAFLISMKGRKKAAMEMRQLGIREKGFTSSTLLLLWTIGGLVLTSAYTGMMFSQKVTATNTPPFTDLETFAGCLERKRCRIVSHATSYSALQLLTTDGSAQTERVGRAIRANPILVLPLEKVPKAILATTDVYLVWVWSESAIMYAINGSEVCRYYTVEAPYKEIYTFPFRKNSTKLLRSTNNLAAPFQENGVGVGLRAKYGGAARCSQNGGRMNEEELDEDDGDLRSMLTVFLFLGVGTGLGMISCVVEVSIERAREVGRKTTKKMKSIKSACKWRWKWK